MTTWLDDSYTSNLLCVHSTRKMISTYAGNCLQYEYDGGWNAGFSGDWLDTATIASTIAGSPSDPARVYTWYDQHTGGYDLTQGTGGLRPEIADDDETIWTITGDAAGATARPALLYQGDYLSAAIGGTTTNLTVAVVLQRNGNHTSGSYGVPFALTTSYSSPGAYTWLVSDWGTQDAIGFTPANPGSALAGITSGSTFATDTPEVMIGRYTSGVMSLFVRDVLIGQVSNSHTPTLATLILGGWNGNLYNGRIGQSIVWTTGHTDEDCQTIARNICSDWEIEPIIGAGSAPARGVFRPGKVLTA